MIICNIIVTLLFLFPMMCFSNINYITHNLNNLGQHAQLSQDNQQNQSFFPLLDNEYIVLENNNFDTNTLTLKSSSADASVNFDLKFYKSLSSIYFTNHDKNKSLQLKLLGYEVEFDFFSNYRDEFFHLIKSSCFLNTKQYKDKLIAVVLPNCDSRINITSAKMDFKINRTYFALEKKQLSNLSAGEWFLEKNSFIENSALISFYNNDYKNNILIKNTTHYGQNSLNIHIPLIDKLYFQDNDSQLQYLNLSKDKNNFKQNNTNIGISYVTNADKMNCNFFITCDENTTVDGNNFCALKNTENQNIKIPLKIRYCTTNSLLNSTCIPNIEIKPYQNINFYFNNSLNLYLNLDLINIKPRIQSGEYSGLVTIFMVPKLL